MSNNSFSGLSHGEVGAVLLPCSPEHFQDFIAGLLGRPQTIGRTISGPFEGTKSNVENVHHLLCQRLESQNGGTLLQFLIKITYSDGTSVTLNSFDEFVRYNEVRPLTSTSAHVSWTWLIKFNNKSHPEKQQIDINFTAGDTSVYDETSLIFTRGLFDLRSEMITVRLAHTDRTWGTDIDNILHAHLLGLRRTQAGLRAFVRQHCNKVGLTVSAFICMCSLFAAYQITSRFVGICTSFLKTVPAENSTDPISVYRKIDFLTEVISSGVWARYSIILVCLLMISILISVFFGMMASAYADNERPSFVLFTEKSRSSADDRLRKYNRDWLFFLSCLGGSLLVGVIGNWLTYLIAEAYANFR